MTASPHDFDQAYSALVSAWMSHQQLRRSGASTGRLFESRRRLDSLRVEAARLRRSQLPDA